MSPEPDMGPQWNNSGVIFIAPHVRSPAITSQPALAILTPPLSPRRLCHAACVRERGGGDEEREWEREGERRRGREGHVNGQCDREHMTLHLWVKTFCTFLPPAMIIVSITFAKLSHSIHHSFALFYANYVFVGPYLFFMASSRESHLLLHHFSPCSFKNIDIHKGKPVYVRVLWYHFGVFLFCCVFFFFFTDNLNIYFLPPPRQNTWPPKRRFTFIMHYENQNLMLLL